MLQEIDDLLIAGNKKSGEFAKNNLDNLKKELGKFIENVDRENYGNKVIYLSDGGLSRIVLSFTDGEIKVSLSDVSTPKVKELWKKMTTG